MADIVCELCPHHCKIAEGSVGFCQARGNVKGKNVCANYGRITSLALDPIEKKPLVKFHPGSHILSVGSYGCNMNCGFCQNYSISRGNRNTYHKVITPEELVQIAVSYQSNLGVAFTYNEPLLSYEYIADTARLLKPLGMKTVLVSNGMIHDTVLDRILPYIDAVNIDLKGNEAFYERHGGDFKMVKNTIARFAGSCHTEVTTLVIPGENDDVQQVSEFAAWLSKLNENIVYHLSRYFPAYHYTLPPTPAAKIYELQEAAGRYLKDVCTGNI